MLLTASVASVSVVVFVAMSGARLFAVSHEHCTFVSLTRTEMALVEDTVNCQSMEKL
jgi:hypothetical protein